MESLIEISGYEYENSWDSSIPNYRDQDSRQRENHGSAVLLKRKNGRYSLPYSALGTPSKTSGFKR